MTICNKILCLTNNLLLEKNNQFFFEDNVDKVAKYKNFFGPIYFSCVRCS